MTLILKLYDFGDDCNIVVQLEDDYAAAYNRVVTAKRTKDLNDDRTDQQKVDDYSGYVIAMTLIGKACMKLEFAGVTPYRGAQYILTEVTEKETA